MSNYIETEDHLNAVARRSIAAAELACGRERSVAQLRAFLVRRRTFLGMMVAFLLVIVATPVPAMLYAGAAMMAAAHVLRLLCSGYIDKDAELATAGPFSWCRNPLYIGNFLVVISFALMSGRALALPVMLLLWLATHAPTVACEEEILREKFGGRFEEYCRRVPRWLPRLGNCAGEGQFRWSRVIENGEHLNIISAWFLAAMFFVEMVR
jgi:protein-S-isoprenylcysteine O-methyltransferase Ste14